MYISSTERIERKPNVRWMPTPPREDWNFEITLGSGRYVYASYEEAKSWWFAMGAALSEFEDDQRLTRARSLAFPPPTEGFVALPLDEVGQELEVDPSFGYFTETGGKAHILRPNEHANGIHFSMCGLRMVEGHPRREGEQPCLNCRTISFASLDPSHREMLHEHRVKVDGDFPLGQSVCLREHGKHEWRWGNRSVGGDRARTRRYCANCGTYFGDGGLR